MNEHVTVIPVSDYSSVETIPFPPHLFAAIQPHHQVLLKPNWVKESHLLKPDDWDYVITHPTVITAVLKQVVARLDTRGKVIIADAPQTDSSYKKLITRYPTDEWTAICAEKNVALAIIDLRNDEWINEGDITVSRIKLPGDPRGDTEVNLRGESSEFFGHTRSHRGYYGADYDIQETNTAHNGADNRYRVSRTVIESDVFINLPKLKTHKKGGITCCLKNLVGINTYKNFLPHHSEGGPAENGDQFPKDNLNAKIEGPVIAFIKQHLIRNTLIARILKPGKQLARLVFGDTHHTIRSGNWHGNDTLWRMVLDLNKTMLYANPTGDFRADCWESTKHYIGIVDGILGGEGNGPMAPDPVKMGYLFCGTNPVSLDAVCARLMGFDPQRIPSIRQAFHIQHYPVCNFDYEAIRFSIGSATVALDDSATPYAVPFKPHFGWTHHVEYKKVADQ